MSLKERSFLIKASGEGIPNPLELPYEDRKTPVSPRMKAAAGVFLVVLFVFVILPILYSIIPVSTERKIRDIIEEIPDEHHDAIFSFLKVLKDRTENKDAVIKGILIETDKQRDNETFLPLLEMEIDKNEWQHKTSLLDMVKDVPEGYHYVILEFLRVLKETTQVKGTVVYGIRIRSEAKSLDETGDMVSTEFGDVIMITRSDKGSEIHVLSGHVPPDNEE